MSTGIRESERVTEQGVHEEWSDVELWEKLEQQKRRRTRWLILATTGVVLLLSALPPLFERRPKWQAISAVRLLAQEINELKREAAVKRMALTVVLRNSDEPGLSLEIQGSPHCSQVTATPESVRREPILVDTGVAWLLPEIAEKLGIQGVTHTFCIDPLVGFFYQGRVLDAASPPLALGVVPRMDIPEARVDRVALLRVRGSLGEFEFQ